MKAGIPAKVISERLGHSEPVLRLLLNQAQLISQLRRHLDSLAHEATDSEAGFISRLEDLGSRMVTTCRAPTSWSWRTIGPHGAAELRTQLTDWVTWIRNRYPLARKIPPCWNEHPELVEELTALWLAWQRAYEDRDAPLTAAADWDDRWLPGVLYRLEHGPFALDCTNEHRAHPPRHTPLRSRSRAGEDSSRAVIDLLPSLPTREWRPQRTTLRRDAFESLG